MDFDANARARRSVRAFASVVFAAALGSRGGAATECAVMEPVDPSCEPGTTWELVYDLSLPSSANWDAVADVPYSVDNSAAVSPGFERVAYWFQLDSEYAFTAMDAFTSDAALLGVPVDWDFDQAVSNLYVRSSEAGVAAQDAGVGKLEFWSNCYGTGNGQYDDDDDITAEDCYGSMQVHTGTDTVWAFNRWSASGIADCGIGNNPGGCPVAGGDAHPDWTFCANCGLFTTRRLLVFVGRPGPACEGGATLDWDLALEDHSYPGLLATLHASWDAAALQLAVDVVAEFVDDATKDGQARGVTYVLDTAPFEPTGRDISAPNNCENREAATFAGKTWAEQWAAPASAAGVGDAAFPAYGPAGVWTVSADSSSSSSSCDGVAYSTLLPLAQVRGCEDAAGARTFTWVESADYWTLTGQVVLTVVSPSDPDEDLGLYLVHSTLTVPVELAFARHIYVAGQTELTLFTMAWQGSLDDHEADIVLTVATTSPVYLRLASPQVVSPLDVDLPTEVTADPTIVERSADYRDGSCMYTSDFRCFQLWDVTIPFACAALDDVVDVGGLYQLQFAHECVDAGSDACTSFEAGHGAGNLVPLSRTLAFTTLCDAQRFVTEFAATMSFYADDSFTVALDSATDVEDTVFVQVDVDARLAHALVLAVALEDVWVCSSSAALDMDPSGGTGGCFPAAPTVDAGSEFRAIQGGAPDDPTLNAVVYAQPAASTFRFSFTMPSVTRAEAWVQASMLVDYDATLHAAHHYHQRALLQGSAATSFAYAVAAVGAQRRGAQPGARWGVPWTVAAAGGAAAAVLLAAVWFVRRAKRAAATDEETTPLLAQQRAGGHAAV